LNEDRATRYHRLKRRTSIIALVWTLAILAALIGSGVSAQLRTAAENAAARVAPSLVEASTVVFYVVALTLMTELAGLPLSLYSGFLLERRYGLSNQRLRAWLKDQAKSLAVGLLLGTAAASLVYFFIRRSPSDWWLPAGALFAVVIIVLANLAPVVLLPLFYQVKPLEREALRARLLALAARAGTRVLGAYEWGLSEKTKKANAALAGLGHTRRILVSDTMLADYSDEEIEVVLAHELAHHVHGDIWKGLIFESVLVLAGFYAAARALERAVPWFGFRDPADVAGLPLLLLVAGAVSLVAIPISHALSRAYERSADRFALQLTKNPAAFISAMKRLAAQNLAEAQPSRIIQVLFYSHPPIEQRIAAAQTFRP
jgi:STE24 endopeptidase